MRTLMRWWLIAFGLVCVGIGLAHLFFGVSTIIGGGTVNPTVDSDMRFYALLFAAYGAGYLWAAADLEHRAQIVNGLGILFFLGGLARLLAWWQSGAPHWFYIVMCVVEFLIPMGNWWWLKIATAPFRHAPEPIAH